MIENGFEPIHPCDSFRSLETVHSPDERQVSSVVKDRITGEYRSETIEDRHLRLVALQLHGSVPRDVRIHFDTARNLLFYSWHCYRFNQVAELHALATAEFALRRRMGVPDYRRRSPGFRRLIAHAIAEGWIKDDGFRAFRRLKAEPRMGPVFRLDSDGVHVAEVELPEVKDYAAILARALPEHRNLLAHGEPILMPGGYAILEICCDLINQLFPKTDEA